MGAQGRFSRLRDGVNDPPTVVRAPLIVSRQDASRIVAGEITQHRVHAPRDPDAQCRFRVGEIHAVQHMEVARHLGWQRAKPWKPRQQGVSMGHVRIVKVSRQRLGDATNADAKANGFRDRAQMLDRWARARNLKRPERKEVFVVELVPETWAQAEMLAKDASHAYTVNSANALPSDKSEVVRPELLRERWSVEAQRRHKAAHGVDGARKRSRQLRDEIRRAADEAARKGIDIDPEIEAMKRELAAIRTKLEAA